jgi:hypothetical protein
LVAAALEGLTGACFEDCACRAAEPFLAGAGREGAAEALPPAFFEGACFVAVLFDCFEAVGCFAAGRACLDGLPEDFEAADFAGAAFRTGAFSAAARFGLGFADCAFSLRLLAEDLGAEPCGAGREELLLAPLMTGSLMRSTRFSQIASQSSLGSRRPPAA